jgi:hypothetical protein
MVHRRIEGRKSEPVAEVKAGPSLTETVRHWGKDEAHEVLGPELSLCARQRLD